MRKFVIKNRPKRKYTRKNEKNSDYIFSKTLYGMLPIIIMGVAFMATIIISTPFRNSLSDIRLTFQLPQISLNNPFLFFQTIIFDITQIGLLSSAVIITLWISIVHAFGVAGSVIIQCMYILNPMPILNLIGNDFIALGTVILNTVEIIIQMIVNIFIQLAQLATSGFISIESFSTGIISSISQVFVIIGQSIIGMVSVLIKMLFSTATFSTQIILWTSAIVLKTILTVAGFIIKFVVFVTGVAWVWISYISIEIFQVISSAFNRFIIAIEIPFKILGAFGLEMKPYLDILGHHLEMTGQDFSNGLNDLGKFSSDMSSSKQS